MSDTSGQQPRDGLVDFLEHLKQLNDGLPPEQRIMAEELDRLIEASRKEGAAQDAAFRTQALWLVSDWTRHHAAGASLYVPLDLRQEAEARRGQYPGLVNHDMQALLTQAEQIPDRSLAREIRNEAMTMASLPGEEQGRAAAVKRVGVLEYLLDRSNTVIEPAPVEPAQETAQGVGPEAGQEPPGQFDDPGYQASLDADVDGAPAAGVATSVDQGAQQHSTPSAAEAGQTAASQEAVPGQQPAHDAAATRAEEGQGNQAEQKQDPVRQGAEEARGQPEVGRATQGQQAQAAGEPGAEGEKVKERNVPNQGDTQRQSTQTERDPEPAAAQTAQPAGNDPYAREIAALGAEGIKFAPRGTLIGALRKLKPPQAPAQEQSQPAPPPVSVEAATKHLQETQKSLDQAIKDMFAEQKEITGEIEGMIAKTGMPRSAVIAEMRKGGSAEEIREHLDSQVKTRPTLGAAYDRLEKQVEQFADAHTAFEKAAAAAQRQPDDPAFDGLHEESERLQNRLRGIPSKEEGKNFFQSMKEKVQAVFKKVKTLIDKVRGRSAEQDHDTTMSR